MNKKFFQSKKFIVFAGSIILIILTQIAGMNPDEADSVIDGLVTVACMFLGLQGGSDIVKTIKGAVKISSETVDKSVFASKKAFSFILSGGGIFLTQILQLSSGQAESIINGIITVAGAYIVTQGGQDVAGMAKIPKEINIPKID